MIETTIAGEAIQGVLSPGLDEDDTLSFLGLRVTPACSISDEFLVHYTSGHVEVSLYCTTPSAVTFVLQVRRGEGKMIDYLATHDARLEEGRRAAVGIIEGLNVVELGGKWY
jgi:hypothetical protein